MTLRGLLLGLLCQDRISAISSPATASFAVCLVEASTHLVSTVFRGLTVATTVGIGSFLTMTLRMIRLGGSSASDSDDDEDDGICLGAGRSPLTSLRLLTTGCPSLLALPSSSEDDETGLSSLSRNRAGRRGGDDGGVELEVMGFMPCLERLTGGVAMAEDEADLHRKETCGCCVSPCN